MVIVYSKMILTFNILCANTTDIKYMILFIIHFFFYFVHYLFYFIIFYYYFIFFFYFLFLFVENMIWHFMMSEHVFLGKIKKSISVCRRLNILPRLLSINMLSRAAINIVYFDSLSLFY